MTAWRAGFQIAATTSAVVLVALPALAQEEAPRATEKVTHQVRVATSAIEVDASLDEPAWEEALVVRLAFEIFPGENSPAPVETVCRLTSDEDNFYLGCQALDPNPEAIRARIADRDTAWNDDFIGIVLDTFNDERRAFEFFVNPFGVQMDLVVNDLAADRRNRDDPNWDAIWHSAGRITEEGYAVEIAIPFTSLRFQNTPDDQIWGFTLLRIYPRGIQRSFSDRPWDRDLNCRLCQYNKLKGFAGAEPGRNLELNPTLTGSKVDEREELEDPEIVEGDPDPQVGLTVRWGVTPNMTLSGALNPDFSQVEADAARLSVNNQFALFFEEKRPFFLEGADFFGTFFRTVHTRVVADPSWGLKLTGKEGRNAVGTFVAEDEVTNILLPGSESSELTDIEEQTLTGVARYRRDVGETSTLGFILTGRQGDEYSSYLGGLDGLFRFTDNDSIRVQALTSSTEYPQEILEEFGEDFMLRPGPMDDQAYLFEYRHDTRNWLWGGGYRNVGTDFRADLGFMPQVDYVQYDAMVEHTWWGEDEDWYSFWEIGGRWEDRKNQRDELLSRQIEGWFMFLGPLQSFFRLNPQIGERGFEGKQFDVRILDLFFEFQPTGSLQLGLRSRIGETVDFANAQPADQVQIRPFMDWRIGLHFRLALNHDYQQLDVEGGRLFTAHLSEVRAVYQLNLRTFFRAIVQRLDVQRDPLLYEEEEDAETQNLFAQLLFSYKVNPRTVIFAGYSEGQEGNQDIPLVTTGRALFVKLGYAWVK